MSLRNNSLAWIDLKKHISDNTEPDFTINLSFFVNENIPNYSTVSGEQGKKFTWATAWTKACRYRWTCPHSRRLIGCVGFNRGDLAILVTRRFTIQFVLLSIWIISPLVDFIVFFSNLLTEDVGRRTDTVADALQVGLELGAQIRFRQGESHGVVALRRVPTMCQQFFNPKRALQQLELFVFFCLSVEDTWQRPMPSERGRKRPSPSWTPTYMRDLMVSMCSACVASVPMPCFSISAIRSASVSSCGGLVDPVRRPGQRFGYSISPIHFYVQLSVHKPIRINDWCAK